MTFIFLRLILDYKCNKIHFGVLHEIFQHRKNHKTFLQQDIEV